MVALVQPDTSILSTETHGSRIDTWRLNQSHVEKGGAETLALETPQFPVEPVEPVFSYTLLAKPNTLPTILGYR